MAAQTSKMADKYANNAYLTVTQSAANALTFAELSITTNVFDKVGMVINRAEYDISSAIWQEMDAEADYFGFGLSTNNTFTITNYAQPGIIDHNWYQTLVSGTPASIVRQPTIAIKDFSSFPGGGILVPARPLYIYFTSAGFASAQTLACRLYFQWLKLSNEDYWELVEATRLIV